MFNEIYSMKTIELKVFYLRKLPPGRQWKDLQNIKHNHAFINEWRIHPHFYVNPGFLRSVASFNPDAIVITQYASIAMQLLMYCCIVMRKPWIFWAEAPGVQYTELPIFLARNFGKYSVLLHYFPSFFIRQKCGQ